MPLIDTHAHPLLCTRAPQEWFANAQTAGLSHIIGVATSIQMGLDTLTLSRTYPQLIPTIGIHPCESKNPTRMEDLPTLLKKHPEFKAIGEIGLDFYHDNGPLADQLKVFEFQLQVARTHQLPVILHSRNADQEMLDVIQRYKDVRKVVHCFSSPLEFAKKINNDTTFFSFTGMITYKNKAFLEPVIEWLPLEKIMIETDCPYLTPTAFAGQENQPAFVSEVALKIATIKNIPLDTVVSTTEQTARLFFNL